MYSTILPLSILLLLRYCELLLSKKVLSRRARCLNESPGQEHSKMTAMIKGITVEIIEQLANGLWLVLVLDTGEYAEVEESDLSEVEF